jgi:prepilin-type N-terminal cleavage/methylation domain-containing protein
MKRQNGFTFIETLIGIAILLIVFLGLYGAFQLGLKIVAQSKARITAIALANQKIEITKNLPYNQVGTIGGIPSGNIEETETITRNNIEYTVKTTIGYVDDPFDGLAPDDSLPNDYKKVKVKVSWPGFLGGEVFLITDIAPKGLETTEGGGNLLISVFSALGIGIGQADIHIVNTSVDPPIDVTYQTNDQGRYLVAGAPSSTAAYQITVTKSGYSTDRTYGTDEVTNPEKPHATVLEGKLTEISFSIDRLSSFSIQTLSPWGSDNFSDSFLDESKISESTDILINQGEVTLATTTDGYVSSGYLFSIPITPDNLISWDEFSWTDNEPLETDIKYQVLYASGTSWLLIPDSDLTGNEDGLESSPVDLTGLATTTYTQLKVKGNLSTNNASTTPTLFDWSVSWITGEPTPIGNVFFNLQGNKIIGTDAQEEPVYKYSTDFSTDSAGQLNIPNLEWDAYNFTIDPAENLDLVSTDPASDPLGQNIDLLPDTVQSVSLFLDAENSLLVTIRRSDTLEPVFSAQVRLYNSGLDYDQTQFTDEQGKTLFIPLETAIYNLEIQADDYESYSGTVDVSGDETITIDLTPIGPS